MTVLSHERHDPCAPSRGTAKRIGGLVAGLLVGTCLAAEPVWAAEPDYAEPSKKERKQVGFSEQAGELADGTQYLIRVPEGWNGVLVRDLDYAQRVGQPERMARYDHLLEDGYAIAGTARHPLRAWQYDPAREIANLDEVLDRFEESFDDAKHVIQFGCSGGGHVALAVAEDFHDRVDGSVVMSAHTPIWLMNTFLDGWFALQTLLGEYYEAAGHGDASDLAIINIENDGSSSSSGHGMEGKLPDAWRAAFDAANKSPDGRARMALAFAIAQWPVWMADGMARPDYADLEALQKAVHGSLLRLAGSPGGEARVIFENAAQGQQLSWNENVDYGAFLANANPAIRTAVEKLYAAAGLEIAADIQRLNDAPGVRASRHALDYWGAAGRTVSGEPGIPVFRLHGLGDYQIPYTLMLGYSEAVEKNNKQEMLRTALVESTGHCTEAAISTAESSAAIETMVQRLEKGTWPETDAATLNALARSLDDSPARFIEVGEHGIDVYNRLWVMKPGQD